MELPATVQSSAGVSGASSPAVPEAGAAGGDADDDVPF